MACKDEGQRLELNGKEKWYVVEVKRVKAMLGTVVWTRTRSLKLEYKKWKSLRGRDYLSKQRMKRQVRGGLLIVSEIRETLRLFNEACDGTGYVARKGPYSKNNQGKGG